MASDKPVEAEITLPVDQEWLVDIINKKAGTSGKVTKVDCEIIGVGKGFVSTITKATFDWEANDCDLAKLPKAVAIKKPTIEKTKALPVLCDLFNEDMLRKIHNQEVNAYEFFTKYPPCPIPMAKCYYAEKRTDDTDGTIITEMIEGRSLSFNENTTLEKVLVLAGHIASIQAYGLNHQDCKEYFANAPYDMWEPIFQQALESTPKLRETFPEVMKISDEDVSKLAKNVRELMPRFLSPADHGLPVVICFGDMQPNNILWKVNEDGTLSDEVAALLDFQLTMLGTPATDITHVISMGFLHKSRKAHKREIFQHYFDCLKSKAKFELEFTIDDIEQMSKEQSCIFSLAGLSFIQHLPMMKEMFGLTDERVNEFLEDSVATFEESRENGYIQ